MDLYHTVITPMLNRRPEYLALANKGLFRMLLGHVGIRQPATLCRRTDGLFYDAADNPISAADAAAIIAGAGRAFVKKAVDTWGGLDVLAYDSAEMTPEALRETIGRMGRNWIAQEPVGQCDELNRLNPNSVNTLRIMSYLRRDGSVTVFPAVLRMSSDKARVDNGSSGGLACGVNPDGRLKDVARPIKGDVFSTHPLTGTRFSDIVVPGYSHIQQQVRDAHARVPQFRLIAWDIAIDRDNEAVLIGLNTNGGLNITQLNNGPLFGSHTREILDEIFAIKS